MAKHIPENLQQMKSEILFLNNNKLFLSKSINLLYMKTISKLFLLFSIILLSSCDETELDQTVTNQVNPQKKKIPELHSIVQKSFITPLIHYLT